HHRDGDVDPPGTLRGGDVHGRRDRRRPRRDLHAHGGAEDVLRPRHAQGEQAPAGPDAARARRPGGLALGAAMVLFAGAAFAGGVWMFGIEQLPEAATLAPWLLIDRFTLF